MTEGDVFWLDDVRPLKGGEGKRRPVIVLGLVDELIVLVVCVTTDLSDPTGIRLPTLADDPCAPTGLAEPCMAIPAWNFLFSRDRLIASNRSGRIPRVTLEQIERAVEDA